MLGTLAYYRILSLLTGLGTPDGVQRMHFPRSICAWATEPSCGGLTGETWGCPWGAVTFARRLDETARMLPSRVPTWSCKQGKGQRYHRLQELLLQRRRRCEHASPAAGTVFRSRPSPMF